MNVLTALAKKEILPVLLKDRVYSSLINLILEETELAYKANSPAYLLSPDTYKIKYEDKVKEYSSDIVSKVKEITLPRYLDYTHLQINDDTLVVEEELLVIPIDYKILYICDKHN